MTGIRHMPEARGQIMPGIKGAEGLHTAASPGIPVSGKPLVIPYHGLIHGPQKSLIPPVQLMVIPHTPGKGGYHLDLPVGRTGRRHLVRQLAVLLPVAGEQQEAFPGYGGEKPGQQLAVDGSRALHPAAGIPPALEQHRLLIHHWRNTIKQLAQPPVIGLLQRAAGSGELDPGPQPLLQHRPIRSFR
ncbi:hypothetical protein D3C75_576710 [compost metagenome]